MRAGSTRLTGAVTLDPDRVLLTVAGALEADTQDTFLPLLDAALAAVGEAGTLQLEVASLEALDSTGLATLAELGAHADRELIVLTVKGATPRLYKQLELARLLEILNVARPSASPALVRGLGSLTQSIATLGVLDAALKLVVTMTQAVVVGADGVSITLPRQGRYRTVAASNDVVLAMDHDQYDTGQGPCLDAARHGLRFHVDSLSGETRWAAFTPLAQARGIASILSSPLLDASNPLGALNIYSRTEGAFAVHEKEWADQFATEVSAVLTKAHELAPSTELLGQIVHSLRSRQVIAQAQGILMHRNQLGPDASYARLREKSRVTGRPLLEICDELSAANSPRGST